jgi:hypothetical protein
MAWTKSKTAIAAGVSILLVAGTTAVIVASREKKPLPTQTMPPSTAAASLMQRPGQYISVSQLAFAGYATPEAALETCRWAIMKGTLEQANDTLAPDMRPKSITQKDRDRFEAMRARRSPAVKGFQIVAKKILTDDKVELKVRDDYNPEIMKKLAANPPPEYMVQPMVKIGDEWKLGGSTREWTASWEKTGQIQTYSP